MHTADSHIENAYIFFRGDIFIHKAGKIDRLSDLYANVLRRMDLAFENYLAQDSSSIEPDDIPKTNNPVWILGRKYNAIQGLYKINFVNSQLILLN